MVDTAYCVQILQFSEEQSTRSTAILWIWNKKYFNWTFGFCDVTM